MVNEDLFEVYRKALEGNIQLMGLSFHDLIKQCEDMTLKELRDFLARAYMQLISQHGSYAAVAAMEFYEMQRDLDEISTRYAASVFLPDNERLLAYDARTLLADQQEVEKLVEKLLSTGTQRVMEYADETLIENARADPMHPRWALVPNAGACGWCQMIASQGFVYKAEGKVDNSRHPHCKCTPVVDFDTKNPSLEGFDPDALYERYKRAREVAEKYAWEEWLELPAAEKAEYGGKRRGAYDHFLRNRIVANIK